MGSKTSKPIVEGEAAAGPTAKAVEEASPFKRSKRKCTDVLCLLFFAVFWIGMAVISILAYTKGQPQRTGSMLTKCSLAYGMDFKGRYCGTKVTKAVDGVPAYDLTDYKYLAYPRLAQDLASMQLDPHFDPTDPANMKQLYGVCVAACPGSHDANGMEQYIHALTTYDAFGNQSVSFVNASYGTDVEDTSAGSPFKVYINSTSVLYRCLELPELTQVNYVRCIDDCPPQNANPNVCGPNSTFYDCGSMGCSKYQRKYLPSCQAVQLKTETTSVSPANNSPIFDSMNSGWFMVVSWFSDLQKAAVPVLVCGALFSLVLGFLWLFMMRFCAGCFVWLTIFLVVVMLLITTFFLAYRGQLLNNADIANALIDSGLSAAQAATVTSGVATASAQLNFVQAQTRYWQYAAYIFIGVDVVTLLLLIFMCGRIHIAVGIIREASKAIGRMPLMVFFPLVPTLLITVFVVYWIITAAYLATSGTVTLSTVVDAAANATGATRPQFALVENDVLNYLLIYHLFGLLWSVQFLSAVGYMALAGAVCEYYWTLNKANMGRVPVLASFYRTLRYHLGTVAFGSLIIAVIQFARLVLEYVDQKLKSAQQKSVVVKVAMLCFKCCLWCFEKCIKFLNKNAYIVVAMKGDGFCAAMKESFSLLFANAARVATVSIISTFLLLLGKVFITSFSCMMLFWFITSPPKQLPSFFLGDVEDIQSPVFPLLVCGLLAYGVSTMFLNVYETAIDTILLCFCEDCKINKESGTYFMSDELLSFVDGAAKKAAFRHYQKQAPEES
ncbi:choline transporter-like protein [Achlya hypogyna]|uniref:Choline transporter-like protein n=1 Tax=Achlya hypogyna TaxID=1202772 RepID=A0A1V9ZMN6_ACHHY|nr:choline transporter-like protein [Achlya hypogyna]